MHTVLRETDARDYDAQLVVGYVLESGANVLCVNAGGITDFWQNPLEAANLNPFLGNRDILDEISKACKANGVRIMGRVDFRGVVPEVYRKFPDWFAKTADQRPMMMTYTEPHLHMACYSGNYRNAYANAYIAEVLKRYELDGIWHNSPMFDGICYCKDCQREYLGFSGKGLPLVDKADPGALDEYMVWKRHAADAYMNTIKQTIKSFGEDKVYTAEVFSMHEVGRRVNSGIDLKNAFDHFDILVSVAFLTENTEMIHYEDFNYAQSIIKFLKSAQPQKEAVVMYGGNGTSHRLVIEPSLDVKIWLWEILSMGGRFWNCYFTNVPTIAYDTRNAFVEAEANYFVKEHEGLLAHHAPVSRIGIYYSRSTRMFYRNDLEERDQFGDAIKGVETVLIENHVPHDFILEEQIDTIPVGKYDLIILPNVQCMSEAELGFFIGFVGKGGSLIATYESSLYDQDGNVRQDFGLRNLFGVDYGGEKWNTRKDNYQFIQDTRHPLVSKEARQTQLLHQSGFTLKTIPQNGARVICTLVPTVHNQPPDKAWVEELSGDYPTVVENAHGKGKVIYFANQPDVITQQMGHPDHRNLLLKSIGYLAPDALLIKTNAPSTVHIGLTESILNKGQYILSLVNTTSGTKRPVRELIPVKDIKVEVTFQGEELKNSRVLRNQGLVNFIDQKSVLSIHLEKLEDFSAIYLETKTV